MPQSSLTLACIAKNEAHNVDQLLNSVKGCVDEIHFTDTGSTDGTVEKAQAHGAKIFHFDWIKDFSAARNFSMSHVKTEYVLWLDLDDVLENADNFKLFKQNALYLADYWMAPYHYSSDDKGNSLCTFLRERIFRTSKQFKWKYPIHEGVIPTSELGPVGVDIIHSWAVRHKRTPQDLELDRSRNLGIFDSIKNTPVMDHRMWFYYGKELFEMDRAQDAIPALSKALGFKDLEMHDRVLATQYLCLAYLRAEAKDEKQNATHAMKAIELAQVGLLLDPHRAEFYGMIGDAYFKLGQHKNAIPSYHAAKSCSMSNASPFSGALFHNKDHYSVYPMEQIATIRANSGDIDGALKEAEAALVLAPHSPRLLTIKSQIDAMNTTIQKYQSAKKCDDITILGLPQGPYEWDSEIAKTKAMGGSETAAIEMAKALAKLSGRKVKVFNNRTTRLETDYGVEYLPISGASDYFGEHEPWININWRHNFKLTNAPTFLWCHDLTTPGAENHQNYVKILCLTPFHKDYVKVRQSIPDDKIYVTRNGLITSRFQDGPYEKDPFRFVFGSSPDRGLVRAMKVLDRVREEFPQIKLHIHYGYEHLHKYGLQALADQLKTMIEERKDWVVYHGATQQEELMKSYKASAYDVQPSDWIETSCISALELVCAGVYPIFRKVGGVADTLAPFAAEGMASLVDSRCETESEYEMYIEETLKCLREERYKRVHVDAKRLDWEHVAAEWLDALPKFAGYT